MSSVVIASSASDRISAYDHVLPTPIPDKGRVLTQLSVWWFDQLTPVLSSFGATHHLVSASDVPADASGIVSKVVNDFLGKSGMSSLKDQFLLH